MDTMATLNQFYNQHDLHIHRLLDVPDGMRAQIIWSPNDSYEKWLTTKTHPTLSQLILSLRTLKENNMLSIFKSCGDVFQYLSAEMLPTDKCATLTIHSLKEEKVENKGGTKVRAILYFKETKRGLVLGNKTNIRSLVSVFKTEDVEVWIGQKVALEAVKGQFFGKMQTVIRVNEMETIQANAVKVETEQVPA